jgi:hypothetical protein
MIPQPPQRDTSHYLEQFDKLFAAEKLGNDKLLKCRVYARLYAGTWGDGEAAVTLMPALKPSKPKLEVHAQEVAALKQRLAEAEIEIAALKAKLHARRISSAAAMLGLGPDRSWVAKLSAGADGKDTVLEDC